MSQTERSSALGPVLFVGLSVYALATYSPPEIVYADPAVTMDMVEAQNTSVQFDPLAAGPSPENLRSLTALPLARSNNTQHAPLADPQYRLASVPLSPIALFSPQALTMAPAQPAKTPAPAILKSVLPAPRSPLAQQTPRPDPQYRLASVPLSPIPLFSPQALIMAPVLPVKATTPAALKSVHPAPRPQEPSEPLFATPPPQTPAPSQTMTIVADFVNLRATPGVQSPPIAQMNSGTLAIFLGQEDRWTNVNLPTLTPPMSGWVFSGYLQPKTRSQSNPQPNSDN